MPSVDIPQRTLLRCCGPPHSALLMGRIQPTLAPGAA
jgi:hypothetical protein